MKTQLKLELNMKKTLLARVVKGIAVCGLAMSSISYAATSAEATHTVVANADWSIEFTGVPATHSGLIEDSSITSRGTSWGKLRVTNNSDFSAVGLLTSDKAYSGTDKGFYWTHEDGSTLEG